MMVLYRDCVAAVEFSVKHKSQTRQKKSEYNHTMYLHVKFKQREQQVPGNCLGCQIDEYSMSSERADISK